jgi:hypothetical protein
MSSFFIPVSIFALEQGGEVSHHEKQLVIDSVSSNLKKYYIFPELADQMIGLLNSQLAEGNYAELTSYEQFGQAITRDLRSLNNDKHLWIWYNPGWIKNELSRVVGLSKDIDRDLLEARKENFGFKEIKILDGNIGYFRFDEFSDYPEALDTIVGVFKFLQYSDALIIDLRNNNGGSPEMVQFLCSFFFSTPSIHLNSLKYKGDSKVTQYWTYQFLPGPRLINHAVYILVSERTASAAEEFAYNLQNLKRAKIIGVRTRGAAHHNEFKIINNNYFMSVPIARAINPITNTNWEGIGIKPDVEIESELAFNKAYKLILSEMLNKSEDEQFKDAYESLLKKLK